MTKLINRVFYWNLNNVMTQVITEVDRTSQTENKLATEDDNGAPLHGNSTDVSLLLEVLILVELLLL
jgi:hypothetical protein